MHETTCSNEGVGIEQQTRRGRKEMSENIETLREQLLAELKEPGLDYNQVALLSAQLVRLDPDNVRFTVDAAHISRLGKELVARQETAVSELVKNAYDAEAKKVELIFANTDKPGGSLSIIDDGLGMTREQLIDGFMRLSSTIKIHQPTSPNLKRSRAGRKGIGRFAAQRLGNKLTVVTQTADSPHALRIKIDWRLFVNDRDLFSIASKVEEIAKEKQQGTTLIIDDLAESWTQLSIDRVYRYISDLIQPFPLSEIKIRSDIDPGFEVTIFRDSGDVRKSVADVQSMVFDNAIAEFEAFVDKEGIGCWSLSSTRLGIDEKAIPIGKDRDNPKSKFRFLRDVHLQSHYFIYDFSLIPRSQFKMIRELALERGGIRVYRNGFRVLPYGEQFNDWLRLDNMQARREILPPAGNINFFGFVQITDPEGTLFEETASREGLIENEPFTELVDFISRVIRAVANRIAAARGTKVNRTDRIVEVRSPQELLREAGTKLAQVVDELNRDAEFGDNPPITKDVTADKETLPRTTDTIKQVAQIIVGVAEQQEKERNLLLQEIGMLRVLASLGLAIGEFTHEIRHSFNALIADASHFTVSSPIGSPSYEVAQDLDVRLRAIRTYTSYFDRAISENARRDVSPQDVVMLVRAFYKMMAPSALRYGIFLHEPELRGFNLYSCPMHPSEWSSLLLNLYTNSRKAIARAAVKGNIHIAVGKEKKNVYLEFSDNGDGISSENEDKIFDAFFTTSTPSSPFAEEQDEVIGTGLGLKIINDIVESYNGDISLVPPPNGYKTCFRVTFPAATRQELEEYGI